MNEHTPMPTDFQMRVRQKMAELGISANAASVRANLSRDAVRKMLEHGAGLPRGGTLSKLAHALETTEQWLLTGDPRAERPDDAPPAIREIRTEGEVEIKATVAGSHQEGAFQIFDNPVGHTPLPRGLRRYTNVYAIIVINDSMIPEHKPGEIRFVTPDVKPMTGDSVVIEFLRDPERGPEAMIGHLMQNGAVIKLGKLNPSDVVEIDSRQRLKLHRIAPYSEVVSSQ